MNQMISSTSSENANSWHQIFLQNLKISKMSRSDYLNQLKMLPTIVHQNSLIIQNRSAMGKIELGILHLHQIVGIYNVLQQFQYDQIPIQIKSIIHTSNQTQGIEVWETEKLIIQQIIDADHYEKHGQFQSQKLLTLLQHRLLCQCLMEIQTHRYKLDTILYKDQCLTQFQRSIHKLSSNIYKSLYNLHNIQKVKISYLKKFPQERVEINTQKKCIIFQQNRIKPQKNGNRITYNLQNFNDNKKSETKDYHQDNYQMFNNQTQEINEQYIANYPTTEQALNKIIQLNNQGLGHNPFYVYKQKKIKKQSRDKNKNQKQISGKKKSSKNKNKIDTKIYQKNLFQQRDKKSQQYQKESNQFNYLEQIQKMERINQLSQRLYQDDEEIQSIGNINSQKQDENSQESEILFLKKQRARIYQHAMTQKVKNGTRLFKHSSSLRWGNKKALSQAEQAYALGRKQFVKQASKY